MLNPAYLTEALGTQGRSDNADKAESGGGDGAGWTRKKFGEQNVNAKLKQCYATQMQLKPFYSGGKIAIIDEEEFVCQYGSKVHVIRKSKSIKQETEKDDAEDQEDKQRQDFRTLFSVSKTLEAELDDVLCFDACPITKVVITAHKSNLLRVWCLLTRQVLKTIKSLHHLPIGFVEICKFRSFREIRKSLVDVQDDEIAIDSARMQLCWITVSGSSVKLWQLGGNQMSKLVRVENITSLGYVKWNGDTFYGAERHIYLMGLHSGTKQFGVLKALEGHYSQVTGLEFLKNNLMVSGGRDKVIIIWDPSKDYEKIKTIPFPNSIEGMSLAQPFDLFVGVNPSVIFHFNVENFKMSKTPVLELNENEVLTGIHSSEFSETLKIGGFLITTHSGTIFEAVKVKEETTKQNTLSIVHQYVGDLDEILCVAIWKDRKVAVANNTTVIKVYDLETGSCEFRRGHNDIVLSLHCNKDMMASSSKDNQVIFWTLASLEPCAVLSGHLASVTSVCLSPSNEEVFSVSEDKFLKVWDTNRLLRGVVAHDKEINSVHVSPNGALVATASRDKTAKIWDVESLQLITTFKGHRKGVWDAKFSSWDQLVVTASADTTIKVWSLTTYDCIQTLQGHLSSVLQVQFINSGLQVLSVSSDGSLKVWELKNSTCLLTEECGNDKVWAMDASPEGDLVLTGSADSTLTLWKDITEKKVSQMVEKKKKLIEDEQHLTNLLNAKEWSKAFEVAIQLDRPYTLLKVVREVSDVHHFEPVIRKLESKSLHTLVNYITKWNTNTKTSTEAQILLNIIVRCFPEEHLGKIVQPMQVLSYTEKHHDRIYRMMRQVKFLQFLADEHGTLNSVANEAISLDKSVDF